jgi:hypothetical protein
MTNVQIKLTEFSDLITRYTADFVGRGWLVEQVNALIENPDCRFVVLTGGPGVGKTAFLAHLAATHPQWPRYFIRRDSRDLLRPGDANTFLLTIGGQLATLYPHLFHPDNLEVAVYQRIGSVEADGEATGARIDELRASPFYRVALLVEQEIRQVKGKATAVEIGRLVSEPRLLQMQDLQYLGLLDPALLLAQTDPDARIVVLVDALDELRYSPAEPDIVRALRELPQVPPNLRFVISSRPEAFLERLLAREDAKELPLDVVGADSQADMRAYAEDALADNGLGPALVEEGLSLEGFVERLLGKTAGNFLYLKSVLSGIQEAMTDPAKRGRLHHLLRVEELPGDLGALYGYFLASIVDWAERRGLGEAAWKESLKPFLGVLAVAQEPLTEQQIAAFTGLKRADIRNLQRELHQFVETIDGQHPAYRIYHTSFAEYLLDSGRNRDYWIDGRKAHDHMTERYLTAWGGLEAGLPGLKDPEKRDLDGGYGLHHLAAHLEGADRVDDLFELVSQAWRQAHFDTTGSYESFLVDVERAWDLANSIGQEEVRAGKRVTTLGTQVKCALCVSSVASLAGKLPPHLPAFLVRDKIVWNLTQAKAYVNRVPDSLQRVRTRLALLHVEEVRKALDDQDVEALSLGILQDIALMLIKDDSEEVLARLLLDLLPYLSETDLIEKAHQIALDFQNNIWRVFIFGSLVPYVPTEKKVEVLSYALQAAVEVSYDEFSLSGLAMESFAVAGLWPYVLEAITRNLPAGALDPALANAFDVGHLETDWEKDSEEVSKRERITQVKVGLLRQLARHIQPGQVDEFLDVCFSHCLDGPSIASIITILAPRLSPEATERAFGHLLPKAISESREYFLPGKLRYLCIMAMMTLAHFAQDSELKASILQTIEKFLDHFKDKEDRLYTSMHTFYEVVNGVCSDEEAAKRVAEGKFRCELDDYDLYCCLGSQTIRRIFTSTVKDEVDAEYVMISPYLLPAVVTNLTDEDLCFILGRVMVNSYPNAGVLRAISSVAHRMPPQLIEKAIGVAASPHNLYVDFDSRLEALTSLARYLPIEVINELSQGHFSSWYNWTLFRMPEPSTGYRPGAVNMHHYSWHNWLLLQRLAPELSSGIRSDAVLNAPKSLNTAYNVEIAEGVAVLAKDMDREQRGDILRSIYQRATFIGDLPTRAEIVVMLARRSVGSQARRLRKHLAKQAQNDLETATVALDIRLQYLEYLPFWIRVREGFDLLRATIDLKQGGHGSFDVFSMILSRILRPHIAIRRLRTILRIGMLSAVVIGLVLWCIVPSKVRRFFRRRSTIEELIERGG